MKRASPELEAFITETIRRGSERNLANKISRGSFTAAFFMMCMDVIGVRQVSLEV